MVLIKLVLPLSSEPWRTWRRMNDGQICILMRLLNHWMTSSLERFTICAEIQVEGHCSRSLSGEIWLHSGDEEIGRQVRATFSWLDSALDFGHEWEMCVWIMQPTKNLFLHQILWSVPEATIYPAEWKFCWGLGICRKCAEFALVQLEKHRKWNRGRNT